MKIAIIIPDRGDRPKFMDNCLRMMARQTLQPYHIEIVDYPAESNDVDITQRYRRGYDKLRDRNFDVIAFIENDDWYCAEYLEIMVRSWEEHKRPNLFGTCRTMYYHLQLKKYFIMEHYQRASAMNTLIKPDLDFKWCVDMEPFTDAYLWQTIPVSRVVFDYRKFCNKAWISIGMKHGEGKTISGGNHLLVTKDGHGNTKTDIRVINRYEYHDAGFLMNTLDEESFEFYNNYFK